MKTNVIMTFFFEQAGELFIIHKYFFVIVYILFLLWLSLIGFFLNLHWGLAYGAATAIVLFIVFSFWGEKIVLYFSRARYVTDDEMLLNQVKNFSCHLGLRDVKIFSSATFPNNVYYAQSYYGKPTLIIGKKIFQDFTRLELNSLVYASLLRLKSVDSKRRTMVSLILLILFVPVYLMRKIFSKHQNSYLNIFLYPGYYLKNIMYGNLEISKMLDREVATLEGLRKEYIAAIFKIANLDASPNHTAGDFLLFELAHIPNKERDVLFDLVMGEDNSTERIEALAGF